MTCCSGINGSHTAMCPQYEDVNLQNVCWAGEHAFPREWACLWSENGSRCFEHEDVALVGVDCD